MTTPDRSDGPLRRDELAAWRPFVQVALRVTNAIDRDLQAGYGITHTDFAAMVMLREAAGQRLRMAQVADSLGIDRSVLTYRVKRLEGLGLVVRERDVPGDARGTFAVLTGEGVSLLRRCTREHVRSVRRHFLDHLEPADLPALERALTKVAGTSAG